MKLITPTVGAFLLLLTLTTPTVAQQKRQAPAKPQPKRAAAPAPAPTLDTLLPADTYIIYGEVRGVGQLIQSSAVNDALEPILKLAGPPAEFKTVVKWLNAHADEVMSSRLLVAAWPVANDIPEIVIAIEFASAEEAAKFATPLNAMMTKLLPPAAETGPESKPENVRTAPVSKPNYHLQQTGSLILLTPTPLTLKKLKPVGSKRLTENISFRTARNRFNSEAIFVYIDLKLMERQDEIRRKQYEAQRQELEKERKAVAAEQEKSEEPPPSVEPEEEAGYVPQPEPLAIVVSPEAGKESPGFNPALAALSAIGTSFFRGDWKWPGGLAFALTFENDSFDLRALFVNEPGEKSDPIPFLPMLISGPPIVSEAPNILPADTQFFASLSLDLPQIYTAMSQAHPNPAIYPSRGNQQTAPEIVHQSPFTAIEEKLKMNVKDDLLPLLGSEIAVRLPVTGLNLVGLPLGPAPAPAGNDNPPSPAAASPILLISLRDKEAVRALMPKIIDALGFKGASSFAQTERKEDTEIVSYLNVLSYAFIGNFLVLSGDDAAVRHVVDSYLKHETLAGDGNFRNSTRWQPRPAQGQLYISPALMESYRIWAERTSQVSERTRPFLNYLAAMAQPITYSLSNEGFGPMHELHIPKNLVLMAVAGIAGSVDPSPAGQNESTAAGVMSLIAHVQENHKKTNGSYATMEQLMSTKMLSREWLESSGYKFEIFVTGEKFEAYATPLEYGKSGKLSYFIDQTRVLRGADRAGAPANSYDPPIN